MFSVVFIAVIIIAFLLIAFYLKAEEDDKRQDENVIKAKNKAFLDTIFTTEFDSSIENKKAIDEAKNRQNNITEAEQVFKNWLEINKIEYKSFFVIKCNTFHVVDFYIPQLNMIIKINKEENFEEDREFSRWFLTKTIYLSEKDIFDKDFSKIIKRYK